MSYKINFADGDAGLIFKRSAGSANTSNDFAQALISFFQKNKAALPALRYVYIDYTESDKLKLTKEDILPFVEIAKLIAVENSTLVVAICAPLFENYCITKQWEVHLPDEFGWVTTAFRDQDKAFAWLRETVDKNLTFA